MAYAKNKQINSDLDLFIGMGNIVFELLKRHQTLLWSVLATAEATYILVKGIR